MKSKIGFHIDISTHNGEIEKIVRSQTRVVKVISAMGVINILRDRMGPETIFIARDWNVGDDFLRFGGDRDPIGAAKRWYDGMRSSIIQAPFAYWESFNEMSNVEALPAYALFEAERQRIMYHEGFACCVGNFSGGSPEIVDPNDCWPLLYPMLEACNQYQNILGLHEYGGMWLDLWYGPNQTDAVLAGRRVPFPEEYHEGWLFGRYRKIINKHLKPRGWTQIRIVLTEFGLDLAAPHVTEKLNPSGLPTSAWKTCKTAWDYQGRPDGEKFYYEQLLWADRQMQLDKQVVGATIFTWGTISDGPWLDHEIEGPVADMLVDYIASTEDAPEPFVLLWPTEYHRVTQPFGANPEYYSQFGLPAHEGIDLAAPYDSRIFACADGVVYYVGWSDTYGNHVRIDHENGYKTIYAHFHISTVNAGDRVRRGDMIGLADSTGNSSGSHLHLTLKKDGATARGETNYPKDIIDPTPFLVFPEHPDGLRLRTTSSSGMFIRCAPDRAADPMTVVYSTMSMPTPEDPPTVRAALGKDVWLRVLIGEEEGWANALYLEEVL